MKKILPALLIGLALGAGVMWFILRPTSAAAPISAPTAAPAAADAAKPPEKTNPLRLNSEQRAKSGITLAKPARTTLAPEVQGYARVLDTTPLLTQIAEIETSRVALETSQKELNRTQKLFAADGNASAQALETAQAAAARDTAAYAAARAKLPATWGANVAKNLAAITTALEHGATLIRIDLLPGDTPAPVLKNARITSLTNTASAPSFTAEIIGPAPTADAQVQGENFLAILSTAANAAPPAIGTTLRATLPGAGEAAALTTIPVGAIVYHQGSAWIYILGVEDTFERKLVTPGRTLPDGTIAITYAGSDDDDKIVTTDAQQLLATELQAGDAAAGGD